MLAFYGMIDSWGSQAENRMTKRWICWQNPSTLMAKWGPQLLPSETRFIDENSSINPSQCRSCSLEKSCEHLRCFSFFSKAICKPWCWKSYQHLPEQNHPLWCSWIYQRYGLHMGSIDIYGCQVLVRDRFIRLLSPYFGGAAIYCWWLGDQHNAILGDYNIIIIRGIPVNQ